MIDIDYILGLLSLAYFQHDQPQLTNGIGRKKLSDFLETNKKPPGKDRLL